MSGPILIVDDDEGIRDFVSEVLRDEGYAVNVAATAFEGLELATHSRPSLILLDLYMPLVSGGQFLEKYRSLAAPRAPVVIFTALHDSPQSLGQLGASGFLPKPFDLEELLAIVANYVPHSDGSGRDYETPRKFSWINTGLPPI